MADKAAEDRAAQLTKQLADQGKLIEGGFAALVIVEYGGDRNFSTTELRRLQNAYMAGAEHVYSSMMNMLAPGDDPTKADLSRMEAMHNELMAWRKTKGM